MLRRFLHRRWSLLLILSLLFPTISFATADDEVSASGDAAETPPSEEDREYYELLRLFADTMDQIERNYVKPVDRRELMEAAIRGALSELDPYSNYIGPDDLDRFRNVIDAEFGGIGIQVSVENGQLRVISPLVGTPAYRAGLQAGDHIIEIEGESTRGISLDEAVRRMKGPIGSEVHVKIFHPHDATEDEVALRREIIRVTTVLGDLRNDQNEWEFEYDSARKIGYIRLTSFSRSTARELRKALDSLKVRGMLALVLDLRFNPGGLLSAAVDISDMFVSNGLIVSTEGRNTKKRAWHAHPSDTYGGFPMVVLVNRYSASASEIVSACLQDHERAIVIGERSWGKGSVQNVIDLENGTSALKLTTASYQRPSGKNIHRFAGAKEEDEWGVFPNEGYEIKLENAEMSSLLTYRRTRDIVRNSTTDGEPAADADEGSDEEGADEEGADEEGASEEEGTGDEATGEEGNSDEGGGASSETSDSPDEEQPTSPDAEATDSEVPGPGEGDEEPGDESLPDTEGGGEAAEDHSEVEDVFVDRQLERALEYLYEQLASAG